jgi:hypothetical protein
MLWKLCLFKASVLFFGSNLSLALETKLPRNLSLELLKCDINSVGGKATK